MIRTDQKAERGYNADNSEEDQAEENEAFEVDSLLNTPLSNSD